jgi:hypothetical protein
MARPSVTLHRTIGAVCAVLGLPLSGSTRLDPINVHRQELACERFYLELFCASLEPRAHCPLLVRTVALTIRIPLMGMDVRSPRRN